MFTFRARNGAGAKREQIPSIHMPSNKKQFWRYVRGLAAPVLLWGLFAAVLVEQLQTWLKGDEYYDQAVLREWIEEARVFRETLPRAVRDYVEQWQRFGADRAKEVELNIQAESIHEQLKSLGTLTLAYSGYQPLFPTIYSLKLSFQMEPVSPPPIDWDSNLPRQHTQYQELEYHFDPRATLKIQYQLHAYNKRRQKEQAAAQRLRWVSLLALAGTALALVWIYLVQRRERERERQRTLAQQQVTRAEHLRLEEELRRREAEQRQEETERKLLEQSLATQAAEGRALEMKSQLYASIGIMAGSYAHNIKNLLVRPNDLLLPLPGSGRAVDRPGIHVAGGASNPGYGDGALAANSAHGAPRPEPVGPDSARPQRSGP